MKKFLAFFIIVMIVGTMFAGCNTKEVVVEESNRFMGESKINKIETEEIIVEEIITEEIITEEIITEDIWVSSEYEAEVEFNSQTNES